MNKVYKVVWSKVKNCYVVVSEIAKNIITGGVKSSKVGAAPMAKGLALGAAMAFVITGNALAADLAIKYDNGIYTATGTEINEAINAGTVGEMYTSLDKVNFAGHYIGYDSYKDKSGVNVTDNGYVEAGLKGGTWEGSAKNVIGNVSAEYSNNTVSIDGGKYNSSYRIFGASTYEATDTTLNANGNQVTVKNVDGEGSGPIVIGGWGWNDANNNSVTLENVNTDSTATLGNFVYAGDAQYGDANNNKVEIKNSKVGYVNGGTTRYDGYDAIGNGKGNANYNEVKIEDSTVYYSVKGGSAGAYGDAEYNKVSVKNLTMKGNQALEGGFSEAGNTEYNTVTIDGANTEISSLIYGGRSQDKGSAVGNKVIINDGKFTNTSAYGISGGITENQGVDFKKGTEGDALENSVTIKGGTVDAKVNGGYSVAGAANENTVTISGGVVSGNVHAGQGATEAKNNTLNITGGTINSTRVRGGYSENGIAEGNTVNVTGGTFSDDSGIQGGYGGAGVKDNVVNITDATVTSRIWGGSAGEIGDAAGNKVVLTDSVVNKAPWYYVYGGYSQSGNAEGNEIVINNTTVDSIINGGHIQTGDGDAVNNKVIINSGETRSNIQAGQAQYGEARGNELIINGGNITVTTGYASIKGGYSAYGNAVDNVVSIYGGTVNKDVYAGYGAGVVKDNVINIGGTANVENASLYGSQKTTDSTGNTLNVGDGWTGAIKSVQNFNAINIEEVEWKADSTAITVAEKLALDNTDGTTVTVDTVRVSGAYEPDAEMTLIGANEISGKLAEDSSTKVFRGVATVYDATVVKDGNAIKIQLGGEDTAAYNAGVMNPQVLVIGESRAAATAFTNQGSELVETGLDALARDKAEDTKAFAAVYGNTSEFATGSEVKVNGWSGIVGVGKTNANGLTVGAFFENGEGNYRTYNDVNGEFMRGDGDVCYNGGGLIVRKDNANGVYTEASLRAGNLQNELRNAVQGSEGLTGYDVDTFYYGAHIGIGKVIARGTEGDSIDVYGKFIYTHHDSEDFTIDGDDFHFDSVDSERLRLGFRINEVQTNKLSMYYGAAWEYEFNGDSNNTVVGYDLSTPSLGGSTVIGELGMHYKASEKWSFDLNGRAYTGQRDGFSGSVQANYSF